jgi:LacI family transcriptional regulator
MTPASVYDVARRARVSAATVSRVINHPALVAERTRTRVHQAMAALEYRPNASAQALSRGRTRVLGALVPHLAHSVFAEVIDAMQKECASVGYSLVVGAHHFDAADELRQAEHLVHAGIDGLMLVGFKHAAALFELLHKRGVAYLCSDVLDAASPHPHVGYDNEAAGARVAEFLIGLGHRRLAVITGHTRKNDRMAARLAGFRAVLRKHGLALERDALFQGDYTLADGRRGLAAVLPGRPSALMCGNDVIALGVLLEAQARKLHVPRQLSVVGFDNLEWAEQFSPALTTMRVPLTELGRQAARGLLARVQGRVQGRAQARAPARTQGRAPARVPSQEAPHSIDVGLELIERGTTARFHSR